MIVGKLRLQSEILLYLAHSVKHCVAVGVKPLAGLFKRMVAYKISIKGKTKLRGIFPVLSRELRHLRSDDPAFVLYAFKRHKARVPAAFRAEACFA